MSDDPASSAATQASPEPTADEVNRLKRATSAVDFTVEILTLKGGQTVAADTPVPEGRWFAVHPTTPSPRRYQFVLQWQGEATSFVLYQLVDGAGAERLPAGGGWQRALVAGRLHVLASDELLTRSQIAGIIGGHEPKPGDARPPNT